MLFEFFKNNGYKGTIIHGGQDIDERKRALALFKNEAQILVATDAAGESLNMQFCHIVINYDLPWNPMMIEQRIGRVDRIGQNCKNGKMNKKQVKQTNKTNCSREINFPTTVLRSLSF